MKWASVGVEHLGYAGAEVLMIGEKRVPVEGEGEVGEVLEKLEGEMEEGGELKGGV